ncbi:hypothetical protein [Streptomyces sp. NBC_00078]|uniref:hypothetical protein n=1 Tax=unclassified Streptomyces TaxID=2593676 RepID=UPI0022553338|nr:hypothetical protein [Streptomyces sp. NBC_00078]MCX5422844.1 hypothetical protein [Streptomyces sp. NBC_00078]
MKRRTLPAAAALAATAALLLTACGSGDDKSSNNDKIAGADTGSSPTSASPTASASSTAGRPKIALSADNTVTFTPEHVGDPGQDTILKDNADFIRALNAAITAQNPRLPALEYYTEGEGAASAQQWVQSFKDAGLTVTGTVRYFDRHVSVESKNTASLTYCGDESKGYTKVVKTNKVKKSKADKNSYVSYGVKVEKNANGVWEMVKIISVRGAAKCQP